ncbi:MAG: hypothetical protein AB8C40_01405 [Gammaproteobacteria bacterium]
MSENKDNKRLRIISFLIRQHIQYWMRHTAKIIGIKNNTSVSENSFGALKNVKEKNSVESASKNI